MRMHKMVKWLIHRPDGWHVLHILLRKTFEKDGTWKGRWEIATDKKGEPLIHHLDRS